jgi:hypothetical protein
MTESMKIATLLACACIQAHAQNYWATTVAGANHGQNGVPATSSPLSSPAAVALDSAGNLYIADQLQNWVRKVTPQGLISTLAGTGGYNLSPRPGYSVTGPAATTPITAPTSVAVDANQNVYIAETNPPLVLRVSAATGMMDVYAGCEPGPTPCIADAGGGPATQQFIELNFSAMTTDNLGNLYIAGSDYTIRKVDTAGNITTIAGTFTVQGYSGDGGPAIDATFRDISALAVDPAGNVYVADLLSERIRMISSATGIITTIAGTGYFNSAVNDVLPDNTPALAANIYPTGIAYAGGSLYIADPAKTTQILRMDLSTGIITTIPFSPGPPLPDVGTLGPGTTGPTSLAVDASGTIYVVDATLQRVLKVQDGVTTAYAGVENAGDKGPARAAFLNLPGGVTLADSSIYVADADNGSYGYLRRIGPDSKIYGIAGALIPYALASDSRGDVFVGSAGEYIEKFPSGNGPPINIAGTGSSAYSGDGGAAIDAGITVAGLAADGGGNLYLDGGGRLRYIDATTGSIASFAGNGAQGDTGDGGSSLNAEIYDGRIALDKDANVYITGGTVIRKISSLQISTIAGTGSYGYTGDGGPATLATFGYTEGIALDKAGNLYVADTGNYRVRKIDAAGVIETIAGTGFAAPWTDDGPALQANLNPTELTVDDYGNVYVTDFFNSRIVRLSPVIAGSSINATGGNGQTGAVFAMLPVPVSVKVVDANGAGIEGVPVTFTVSPENAAGLAPAWLLTGADGSASALVALGPLPGLLTITASAPGLPSVVFTATVERSFRPRR